jgi:hypothetical protein
MACTHLFITLVRGFCVQLSAHPCKVKLQFDRWLATSMATTLRLAPTRVATTWGLTSGGISKPSETFSDAANLKRYSRYGSIGWRERRSRQAEVRVNH